MVVRRQATLLLSPSARSQQLLHNSLVLQDDDSCSSRSYWLSADTNCSITSRRQVGQWDPLDQFEVTNVIVSDKRHVPVLPAVLLFFLQYWIAQGLPDERLDPF